MRTYSELIQLPSFEDRFAYLKLDGRVAEDSFGWDRWVNQKFYHTSEWKRVRDQVIVRDMGYDLASRDHAITGQVLIHHMNPIGLEDLLNHIELVLDPEFLICTSKLTHNAIHYGDINLLPSPMIQRSRNDTCPWRT